jgi:hypothetical protein
LVNSSAEKPGLTEEQLQAEIEEDKRVINTKVYGTNTA